MYAKTHPPVRSNTYRAYICLQQVCDGPEGSSEFQMSFTAQRDDDLEIPNYRFAARVGPTCLDSFTTTTEDLVVWESAGKRPYSLCESL